MAVIAIVQYVKGEQNTYNRKMARHKRYIQNLVGKNKKKRLLCRRRRIILKITGVIKEQNGRMWTGFMCLWSFLNTTLNFWPPQRTGDFFTS
jgi:hypothetical protein